MSLYSGGALPGPSAGPAGAARAGPGPSDRMTVIALRTSPGSWSSWSCVRTHTFFIFLLVEGQSFQSRTHPPAVAAAAAGAMPASVESGDFDDGVRQLR